MSLLSLPFFNSVQSLRGPAALPLPPRPRPPPRLRPRPRSRPRGARPAPPLGGRARGRAGPWAAGRRRAAACGRARQKGSVWKPRGEARPFGSSGRGAWIPRAHSRPRNAARGGRRCRPPEQRRPGPGRRFAGFQQRASTPKYALGLIPRIGILLPGVRWAQESPEKSRPYRRTLRAGARIRATGAKSFFQAACTPTPSRRAALSFSALHCCLIHSDNTLGF